MFLRKRAAKANVGWWCSSDRVKRWKSGSLFELSLPIHLSSIIHLFIFITLIFNSRIRLKIVKTATFEHSCCQI